MPDFPAFYISFQVKKSILILLIFISSTHLFAIDVSADLFTYDEANADKEFKELHQFDSIVRSSPDFLISDITSDIISKLNDSEIGMNQMSHPLEIAAPGKLSSFWFSFVLSSIGTYSLYGVVAGPISVGIVYFSSQKDNAEVKKAFWGCITGTIISAGIKYAVYKL